MEKRGQFTFYRSYYEAAMKLEQGKRENILVAMITYALDGTEPENLSVADDIMFTLIRPTLDSGRKKAAAGRKGAEVTNRIKNGKASANARQDDGKGEKENEIEIKKEIEIETETEAEGEDACAGFDAFWCAYPCQIEKQNAFLVWQRLKPDTAMLRQIMDGLAKWKKSKQWQAQGGRFVPRAARWLEGEYFRQPPEDDSIPKGASGILGQAEYEAIERMMRN